MNKTVRIATLLLFCAGYVDGMQQRLPLEIQEEIEARDFINQVINANVSEQAKVISQALGFLNLFPRFAKKQDYIDTLLDICLKKFHNAELARVLADRGIEPAKQWLKDYQLSDASIDGNSAEMEKLLKEGARVNMHIRSSLPLINVASNQNTNAMTTLLKHGADVNATANDNRTALMTAARYANLNGVKLLLSHKANPNARDIYGQTALHAAIHSVKTLSRIIVTPGTTLSTFSNNCIAILTALLAAGADINSRDNEGKTPLALTNSILEASRPYSYHKDYRTVLEPIIEFLKSKGATA